MIDKPGQISAESGQGGVSRPTPSKSRPDLTPSEIISLGIQQGHSADVILASLEAAGFVVVPVVPTTEMQSEIWRHTTRRLAEGEVRALFELWAAALSARPK